MILRSVLVLTNFDILYEKVQGGEEKDAAASIVNLIIEKLRSDRFVRRGRLEDYACTLIFAAASDDFQFAAAVAGFGLLLRDSQYKGNLSFAADLELAQSGLGPDDGGYRAEFLDMVRAATKLKGE